MNAVRMAAIRIAGNRFPTLIFAIWSIFIAMPRMSSPPVAVISVIIDEVR